MLAAWLYDALVKHGPGSNYIVGEPKDGTTLIDGTFDLKQIARDLRVMLPQ